MDRITKGYMNNFAASQELTGQNESELFELFACYCVLSKEYPEHFDISDIVTGGGSDAGIDGIAIIANNVNKIYGIPQQMLNGVINFELKPIDNQD